MTTPRDPRMPPWWPEDHGWPRPHGDPAWRGRGLRFRYRFAGLLTLFLPLAFFGVIGLLRTAFGGGPPEARPGWPFAIALTAIVFIFVFTRMMRRVGGPLSDVIAAAERVAGGDFAVRVRAYGPPWLQSLASAFNRMTSTLQQQQRQRRDLMADVAHELRTPLAVMQGRLEGMLDGIYPPDEHHVAEVLEQTRTLARLVEDLRTLAHSESGTLTLQREPTDLGLLIGEVRTALRPQAEARAITIAAEAPSEPPLLDVDPLRIREVLTNLVANAIRYAPDSSTVRVALQAFPDAVQLRVTDTGPGIAAEDLPRIFDRFYKSASSSGSGLGLTIARNLVTAHGGTLTAESRIGAGTTMTVSLPRGQTPS